VAKVKNIAKKFSEASAFLCLCLVALSFVLSISLVKSRQRIVLIGRKISELEKNLSANATKNAELDVKILRLCSSESLRGLVISDGLVLVNANDIVKIPRSEINLHAMAHANAKVNAFASADFQRQTSLTANN
jgi:cell division protein FtsL